MQLVIFYLYLIFHACAARFDVTGNLEKILDFGRTKHGLNCYVNVAIFYFSFFGN